MPPEDDRDLRDYWDSVRLGGPTPEPVERRFAGRHPGDLIIGTSKERIFVRIHPDGQITYGPGYTPDSAAVEFWTAMAVRRLESEARLIQFSHQEGLMLRIAQADVAYENAQLRARNENATEHDRFMEEMSRRNLESQVHTLIEYARGLLTSREIPIPRPASPAPTSSDAPVSDDPAPSEPLPSP